MTCAFPIIISPVFIENKCYIDGGITCNYPLSKCIETITNTNEIVGFKNQYNDYNQHKIDLNFTLLDFIFNLLLKIIYNFNTDMIQPLIKNEIICKLRPIGDGAITRTGWFIDTDGSNRRTSHTYTAEQQEWFWKQQGFDKKSNNNLEGNQMGRACCGGICLSGKVDDEWKTINLIDTDFKDWYCLVDWFFLYIDQETKDVYHHQTCKALLEKKKGPIGNLSNSDLILNEVSNKINQKIIPNIICPNKRCGCGMCVPKAKNIDDFVEIRNSIIV
jgi:hypothetical protein